MLLLQFLSSDSRNRYFYLGLAALVFALILGLLVCFLSPSFFKNFVSFDGTLAPSTVKRINVYRNFGVGVTLLSLLLSIICLSSFKITILEKFLDSLSGILSSTPFWVWPLILAILWAPLYGVNTTPDSSWYISNGLNIYKGNGYVDSTGQPVLTRGPVFPGLIAISFWLLGPSIAHAFIVVRLFYVLTAILVFALGKVLYNKWIGLSSSLLVLVSYAIAKWSARPHLDIIMPFFVLLGVLCFYLAIKKQSRSYFILSGLAFALAYLTKESAILFFVLPVIALFWSGAAKLKGVRRGLVYCYGSLIAPILPWAVYVVLESGSVSPLLGGSGPLLFNRIFLKASSESTISGSLFSQLSNYFSWFGNYWSHYFGDISIFPSLFITIFAASWAYVIYRSLRNRKLSDQLLVIIVLCYGPVLLFLGREEWREGQNFVIYLVSYIALAVLAFKVGKKFYEYFKTKLADNPNAISGKGRTVYLKIALIIILLVFQVGAQPEILKYWSGVHAPAGKPYPYFSYYYLYPNSYYKPEFHIGGFDNELVRDAASWLEKHTSGQSVVTCDSYWLNSIYFQGRGSFIVSNLPIKPFSEDKPLQQDPLFVWPKKGNTGAKTELLYFSERALLEQIKEKGSKYIVVTFRRNFLALYFDQHPGFIKKLDKGAVKIYEVVDPSPLIQFQTHVGEGLIQYLFNLKANQHEKYEELKNNKIILEITKIMKDEGVRENSFPLPQFEINKVY